VLALAGAAFGDDLDHAAGRAFAVQHAAAAADDLDALDGVDRDGRQHRAGQFVLVQAHAVDHDHHVLALLVPKPRRSSAEVGRRPGSGGRTRRRSCGSPR
jgi:hypothetical protein